LTARARREEWRWGRRPGFLWLCVALSLALGLALAPTASAQTPAGTVVASGLANPRGVAVGADGAIYVAESGTGGSVTFTAPPPFGPSNAGMTAQITRVAADGSKRVLAGQ
jgi:glucose/arabinose dehydrogenase